MQFNIATSTILKNSPVAGLTGYIILMTQINGHGYSYKYNYIGDLNIQLLFFKPPHQHRFQYRRLISSYHFVFLTTVLQFNLEHYVT